MTAWLIGQLFEFWPLIAGLIAIPVIYWRGKHNGKVDAYRDTLENYAKRRKAMDDVESDIGDDPSAAQRWLRERGK